MYKIIEKIVKTINVKQHVMNKNVSNWNAFTIVPGSFPLVPIKRSQQFTFVE